MSSQKEQLEAILLKMIGTHLKTGEWDTSPKEFVKEEAAAITALIQEAVKGEAEYIGGKVCACELAEPCMSQCTCATPVMSGGCMRCATYGSYQQKQAAAQQIVNSGGSNND